MAIIYLVHITCGLPCAHRTRALPFPCRRVIGWRTLAANLLNVINGGQFLVGGGLVAVAGGLHSRSDGTVHADAALLALGVAVLIVSSIGLLAARLRSSCLLRCYTVCTMLLTFGLCAFVAGLEYLGVQGLADSAFLAANWHFVREIYPITREEFLKLLGRHWWKLAIAAGLLALVQLLVAIASCVLRRALLPPRIEKATESERTGLIAQAADDAGVADDAEDGSDDGGVQIV